MKPKVCIMCKSWMSEDEVEYWCDCCGHSEFKRVTTNWDWGDE